MGLFTKDIKAMDDLFVHTLRDIYYAEHQIEKNLPAMFEKASDAQLKSAFELHLEQTKRQIERLERVFEQHGVAPKGVTCEAIDGILSEAKSVMGEVSDPQVLDAAMLANAQAVEHYEITRYGTLVTWAKELGRQDCAALLAENLDEEERTDVKLSELAKGRINRMAA